MSEKKQKQTKKNKHKKWLFVLLAVLAIAILAYLSFDYYRMYQKGLIQEESGTTLSTEESSNETSGNYTKSLLKGDDEIPLCSGNEYGKTHEIIKHGNYTLCYCEKFEQPEWVAYELTSSELNKVASRKNNFHSDPSVSTGSATPNDYYKSGYDRGHLAPAADMSFSEDAMNESFFMSNMSPQHPDLNRGLWLEMEKIERDWAKRYGSVYIVSGPVLNKDDFKTIGENQVAVPDFFYKILVSWDESASEGKGGYVWVAYLAPNTTTNNQPSDFVSSVSEIENLTGIDFFPILNNVVK